MSGTGMPSGVSRSVLLMLLSVFLFASNTLLVRAVASYAPQADGWLAALLRGVVGLAVVFALFGFGRGLRTAGMFNNRLVFLRGVVGAFGILAFYITVTRMGAARAVILNLTYPLWGTIIAALWLKERIRPAAMAWMAAGFAGLLLFLGGDGTLLPPKPLDLLGLAGAMTAGWVVVIIRRLRHEEHPATVYASQAFYGLLFAEPKPCSRVANRGAGVSPAAITSHGPHTKNSSMGVSGVFLQVTRICRKAAGGTPAPRWSTA